MWESDVQPDHLGDYELLNPIGEGGMGIVWRAFDSKLRREVALKLLRPGVLGDQPTSAALSREARALAAVEHPAIVPIYELRLDEHRPYMIMRLMTGGTLTDRLRSGRLSVEQATRVVTRVAGALDALHARGMTHTDVKPSNILFDQESSAYLSDFGIARFASATQSYPPAAAAGVAEYMSPERIKGGKADPSWDIYGLAMVCFQALAGRPAFEGDDWEAVMYQQLNVIVPSLSDFSPEAGARVSAVLSRALAKDPSERFPTASSFAAALEAAADTPSHADPLPSPLIREHDPAVTKGRTAELSEFIRVTWAILGLGWLVTWAYSFAQSWQSGLETWAIGAGSGLAAVLISGVYVLVSYLFDQDWNFRTYTYLGTTLSLIYYPLWYYLVVR